MTESTAQSNYWEIATWYDTPRGKVAKGMWIGHAENPADRIWWENPEPLKDVSSILNFDKPQSEQFWQRHEYPACWSKSHVDAIAIEKYSTGTTPKQRVDNADYYWYFDKSKLTKEQFDYQDREWERRLEGVWILINGVETYLTGKYYTYLQHWWIVDCYPEYRDRDLLTFYAWQSICNDSMCYGGMFPKHRRAGDTTKWSFEAVEEVTRTKGGHFGIQAQGDNGAGKIFNDKVKPGWKRWPLFFKPISSSGDNPKTEIVMDAESRRGRSQHNTLATAELLEGWIKYAPNGGVGEEPFDGDKLTRFFRDEGGKEKKSDIVDTWGLVKPTLTNRLGRGKSAWSSTVEDVGGKYAGAFERMCYDSMPSLVETTGTRETITGLKVLFIPCYCGHEEFWFIGKYGESIVHKPTPEQREWLLEHRSLDAQHRRELEIIYDQGGAYEYEVRRRFANKNDIKHRRKFPFSLKDVFVPTNEESDYNIENCDRMMRELSDIISSGMSLYNEITIHGNLEWVCEFKGQVKFVPSKDGRFIFNKPYMPGQPLAEKLRIINDGIVRGPARQGTDEVHGSCRPGSDTWIVIGTDPQKTAKVDMKLGRRYSSAAAHGFYKYRYEMEKVAWTPQLEIDPEFAKDWITHSFIFEYICHPKNPAQHHEDMLKACFYLNAKLLFERQVNEIGSYFTSLGCRSFLITDRDWIKNPDNAVIGLPSSKEVIDLYKDRTKNFIDYFAWARLCPFPRTIRQWIEFKVEDIEKLDAQVSSGYALLAAQPKPIRKEQKKTDIAPDPKKEKIGIRGLINLYI